MTAKPRPRNLGLFHMRLPIGAWVSIVHRVTGVLLVLALPIALYALDVSLSSATGFGQVRSLLHQPLLQLATTVLIWVFVQHFFSGLRHLLLDIDVGIAARAARASAGGVFVLAVIVSAVIAWGVVW